jgi:molybdopterin converting factor small subunit
MSSLLCDLCRNEHQGIPINASTVVRIEFYGIPRQRAQRAATTFDVSPNGTPLQHVLQQLAVQFPALSDEVIADGKLREGYVANIAGERFVSDPSTPLLPGDCVLIMSADAGG